MKLSPNGNVDDYSSSINLFPVNQPNCRMDPMRGIEVGRIAREKWMLGVLRIFGDLPNETDSLLRLCIMVPVATVAAGKSNRRSGLSAVSTAIIVPLVR